MHIKKLSFILLVLVTIFALVGCSGATEAPMDQGPTEPVTLTVYVVDYAADATDVWLEDEVVPAFQEMHPDVEIEFVWGSWGTFSETVAGYFAAGEGPDIINLGSEFNGLYGDQLAPLNDRLGPEAWPEIENFIPGTLENASWDGELRGLPIFSAPRYVFCRTDLMEAAGYDAQPTNFADWVKFAETATVIDADTNALTQQGFVPVDAGTMADFQWYLNTIWSLGGTLYKDDGITPNFDSPEADAAIQFNYDLKRAVYPDDTVGTLPEGTGSVIEEGNGAVCLWHSGWAAPALDSEVWEKIDIQPFTGDLENFSDSRPIVLSFVDWWAVPAYSPNVDMAAEFMKFVFSKDNNHKYNETMNLIPARSDAHTGYVVENPVLQREAELAAEYSYGFAGILEPTKLQDILQRELGAYLTDQQDKETTLKNIQEQYTQVLVDAGYIE
ncbi:MAG: extracellular solute-binding protein [Anaerolineae bacterium]|nr:extracellular solute-binding protein [Anaerolineae bacterium]